MLGDEPLTPEELLRLQRTAGNQAVLRLLRRLRRDRAMSMRDELAPETESHELDAEEPREFA